MEVGCVFFASSLLVDVSAAVLSSSLKFLGLRWAPAPFQHRSAGWFVLSQVGHFGYSFLVSCPSLRRCSSFRLSFQQSSLTCPGYLQSLQVMLGSMPEERRPVPGRVAVGAVDIVGTGMSSPSSSPLSSSSRSKWVTISS